MCSDRYSSVAVETVVERTELVSFFVLLVTHDTIFYKNLYGLQTKKRLVLALLLVGARL